MVHDVYGTGTDNIKYTMNVNWINSVLSVFLMLDETHAMHTLLVLPLGIACQYIVLYSATFYK